MIKRFVKIARLTIGSKNFVVAYDTVHKQEIVCSDKEWTMIVCQNCAEGEEKILLQRWKGKVSN